MKFDFAIGNPPYQEQSTGENKGYAAPIYDKFIEAAQAVSDKVEMIHPARFLFNAGSTPKSWNEKMLNDPHLKVLTYEEDASKVFSNTDIKGGVAITYFDRKKVFGAIGVFTKFDELNAILKKVTVTEATSITSQIFIQNRFNLAVLLKEHPEVKSSIGSDGKDSRFEKNIFVKIPLFSDSQIENSTKVLGILQNKRAWKYLPNKYVDMNHENLQKFKVVIPVANGSGRFGQTLSSPLILAPGEAFTRSFISIGACDNKDEAEALLKYVKTKFARGMLSVLKVTQMTNKDVWKHVPMLDFSEDSEIDWSVSIPNIDKQLYKKYQLTEQEISFLEKNVEEMQ